jgi:hypothetical protein
VHVMHPATIFGVLDWCAVPNVGVSFSFDCDILAKVLV